MSGELISSPTPNSYVVGVTITGDDDAQPAVRPAITVPADGATVPPVFDIEGVAPPGSTVELHCSDNSTVLATTTATTGGGFSFPGDTPAAVGTNEWWVSADGDDSAHITVTVSDTEPVYDPGAHTVEEVRAYVDAHPDERDAVIAAETAGKNRSTLLEALSA